MFCLCSVLGILWHHVIFKSLSHFEFIFVYVVRQCSSFINLHAAGPAFPAALAEETAFSLLYILASSVKDVLAMGVRIHFWDLYSILLISMSVFVPGPLF